jgi:hypothetical protein
VTVPIESSCENFGAGRSFSDDIEIGHASDVDVCLE